MKKIFGTDGARGIANKEITCELAMKIGMSISCMFAKNSKNKPKILVGFDTRISSDMLKNAIAAGICSAGSDAVILGAVPTPAVAYLIKKHGANGGVMISASHNSFKFNGIKIFDGNGFKLSDKTEKQIEDMIFGDINKFNLKTHENLGISYKKNEYKIDYINYLKSLLNGNFKNLKIAIDCANGSASSTAGEIFSSPNCQLFFNDPNGTNINDNCGSTYLENLCNLVKKNQFDLGIAFDGDADRCLFVDENGDIIDGDVIMAICALDAKMHKNLKKNTVVGTIMTNMSFRKFYQQNCINFIETKVGDRYILEEMTKNGYNFGGEQSGHVIFYDHNTTGDGQLTAIKLLNILSENEKKLSILSKAFSKFPQVTKNIKIDKNKISNEEIHNIIQNLLLKYKNIIKKDGRVVVRKSGTEPLIRVMVEHVNMNKLKEISDEIIGEINNLIRKFAQN